MSGQQFAKLIAVDLNTVYKWERNLFAPPMRYMKGILDFLGYDPGWNVTRLSGKEIVAYRSRQKLSQKAFARILHVNVGALRRWERNQRRPPRRIFERLCSLLGERCGN